MSNVAIILLNGLTYSGLLFMCASGLTLIFGLMRVVNMSHGIFYLCGAYIGWVVQHAAKNWFLAILAGGIFVGLLAVVIKVTIFKKVLGNDLQETLLTLGITQVVGDVLLAVFGGMPQSITASRSIARAISVGGIFFYPGTRLFILAMAVLQGGLLWLLIQKTRFGQIVRAGVDDRDMVSALGINIDSVFTIVFLVGGFLAGISGVMGGSYLAFTSGTDMTILTYSLVVVIVGGMGSLGGAALGALLVGMTDSITKSLVPNLSMVIIFGILMMILAFRPNGIFGKER
ncbi:MAG: branched-chain amino acid ABC transporter permease [Synergistaceae bacterium]|jgi:branched-chain amino acid transport system permease protein|nr:branched-chain amino acid ABC transporter permease [Synergistaceae bacterium]